MSTYNSQKPPHFQVSHSPVRSSRSRHTTNDSHAQKLAPNNKFSNCIVPSFDKPTYETTHTSFSTVSTSARNRFRHSMQQEITWVKRLQCAHSKVQARSNKRTTTSTRVRTSGTVRENAGGSSSDSKILHLGMMAAATTMKMIAQSNVLPQIRSSTVPGRVANCSRLPLIAR